MQRITASHRSYVVVFARFCPGVALLLLLLLLQASCATSGGSSSSRGVVPASGTYRIRSGDTLYGIATRYGLDYRDVARWNGIRSPYTIYRGNLLRLRPGVTQAASGSSITKTRTSTQNKTLENNSKKTLKIVWQWPLKGTIAKRFSPPGSKGIDIAAKVGDLVMAAAAGTVVYSGKGYIGYNNLVIIKHSDDYLSAYANNRRLRVKEGETVRLGQVIAEVGAHGNKSGSLHFEIRKNSQPDNPLKYLP